MKNSLLLAALDMHPTLPDDGTWVGVLLIAIAALFLAAMIIGPLVRLNAPQTLHDPHFPAHRPHP